MHFLDLIIFTGNVTLRVYFFLINSTTATFTHPPDIMRATKKHSCRIQKYHKYSKAASHFDLLRNH